MNTHDVVTHIKHDTYHTHTTTLTVERTKLSRAVPPANTSDRVEVRTVITRMNTHDVVTLIKHGTHLTHNDTYSRENKVE